MSAFHKFATAAPTHALRLVRFVSVGILNTVVGYGVYLLGLAAGFEPAIALAIATAVGAVFNYFTTSQLVFAEHTAKKLPKFLLVYAVVYVLNIGILTLVISLGVSPGLAQALVLPIVAAASYVVMNIWVFPR